MERRHFGDISPFHSEFKMKAKKVLKDVAERKEFIKKASIEIPRVDSSKEYYEMIDNSVYDSDALESLRLKRLMNSSIKTCGHEVQEEIEKQLLMQKQSKAQQISISEDKQEEIKPSVPRAPMQVKRPFIRPCQKTLQHKTSPLRSCLHPPQICTSQPLSQLLRYRNDNLVKSSVHVNEQPYAEKKTKESFVYNKKFMSKLEAICPNIGVQKQPFFTSIQRKPDPYFPCAIEIEPPCRVKPSEMTCETIEEQRSLPVKNMLKDAPKVIQQPPPLRNIGFVDVVSEKPAEKNLMIQALPSINIIGRSCSKVSNKNNVTVIAISDMETPEKCVSPPSSQHNKQDVANEVSSTSVKERLSSSTSKQSLAPCFDPNLLSSIALALDKQPKENEPENESLLDEKQMKDLLVNILREEIPRAIQSVSFATNQKVEIEDSNRIDTEHNESVFISSNKDAASNMSALKDISPIVESPKIHVEHHQSFDSKEEAIHNSGLDQSCDIVDRQMKDLNISDDLGEMLTDEAKIRKTSTPMPDLTEDADNFMNQPVMTKSLSLHDDFLESQERFNRSIHSQQQISSILSTKKDAATQFCPEKECQAVPETKEASTQWMSPERPTSYVSILPLEVSKLDASIQFPSAADTSLEFHEADMKDTMCQSEVLDASTASSTNISENDFVDDLLSEGEVPLPWNLRLLSLIERRIFACNQAREVLQRDSENSLSEGEIPPDYIAMYEAVNAALRTTVSSDSSSYRLSEGEIHPQFMAIHNALYQAISDSTPYPSNSDNSEKIVSKKMSIRHSAQFASSSSEDTSDSKNIPSSFIASSEESVSEGLLTSADEKALSEGEIDFGNVQLGLSSRPDNIQSRNVSNTESHFKSDASSTSSKSDFQPKSPMLMSDGKKHSAVLETYPKLARYQAVRDGKVLSGRTSEGRKVPVATVSKLPILNTVAEENIDEPIDSGNRPVPVLNEGVVCLQNIPKIIVEEPNEGVEELAACGDNPFIGRPLPRLPTVDCSAEIGESIIL